MDHPIICSASNVRIFSQRFLAAKILTARRLQKKLARIVFSFTIVIMTAQTLPFCETNTAVMSVAKLSVRESDSKAVSPSTPNVSFRSAEKPRVNFRVMFASLVAHFNETKCSNWQTLSRDVHPDGLLKVCGERSVHSVRVRAVAYRTTLSMCI